MPKTSTITQAIHYLQSHWRKGQTLKEVAELHRVDAGNLDRIFRNQKGMTIKQFVDQQRKEYVLLHLGNKAILGYAIGAELGFVNDLSFYRWVKRAFGVSFSVLRAQVRRPPMTRKRNKE